MYDEQNQDKFLGTIRETNIEICDFIDAKKILRYVKQHEIDLNTLNYIIDNSSERVIEKIKLLFTTQPAVFKVVPLLIAIRRDDEAPKLYFNQQIISLTDLLNSVDNIIYLFQNSGLLTFITSGRVKNFVDYLTGVEVGKDTNARKNRFGKKFEDEIEGLLEQAFDNNVANITIEKQVKVENIGAALALPNPLAGLSEQVKVKKIDFVISNPNTKQILLIETSHYNSQGSKINETGSSYLNLVRGISNNANYQFLWVTDGGGIKTIQKKILAAHLYQKTICNTSSFIQMVKAKLSC